MASGPERLRADPRRGKLGGAGPGRGGELVPDGGDGGHSQGQRNLAVAYHNGRGVERDATEAMRWNLMAAEQGGTVSQIAIGDDVFHR
ncbi:MAG: sel1 repeat family protein [Caldilineaceae bacterium SB0668_bin_21]|nr:sel1 repeat family protein [Caldilineaceae bacterium SB0668_bin_21]MYC21824.1 sel1 repeat family protein [Caldilineaceae bacterium SB0662_bin_25]